MDAQRFGDAMSESAIDCEVQAMLAVDPSPEFVARVRTRIMEEPQPSASWLSWLSWKSAAVVAVAALVVLAAVMARPRETVRSQPVERRASSTDGARPTQSGAATAQGPDVASAARRTTTATGPARAGHRVRATDPRMVVPPEAEVMIDARESSALRALILDARDGRVDLEPVLRAATPTLMDLPPVGGIDIPFITIDPIAPGTGEEGVRQ
jgi:hypothetical protein